MLPCRSGGVLLTRPLVIQTLVLLPDVVLAMLGIVVAVAYQETWPRVTRWVLLAEALNLFVTVALFVLEVWSAEVWRSGGGIDRYGLMMAGRALLTLLAALWPVGLAIAAVTARPLAADEEAG